MKTRSNQGSVGEAAACGGAEPIRANLCQEPKPQGLSSIGGPTDRISPIEDDRVTEEYIGEARANFEPTDGARLVDAATERLERNLLGVIAEFQNVSRYDPQRARDLLRKVWGNSSGFASFLPLLASLTSPSNPSDPPLMESGTDFKSGQNRIQINELELYLDATQGDKGEIDPSKKEIKSRPVRPFEAKAHFAGSRAVAVAARELFQEELRSLPDAIIPIDQIDEVVAICGERSESIHSALRVEGKLITIAADESEKSLTLALMDDAKRTIDYSRLQSVEMVPISELPATDAALLLGKSLGKKQATAFFTKEHQSRAGKIASEKMTTEQKTERARKASLASNEKMTAEQKTERARKAALSRWSQKHLPENT